ncbi:hypothetical protein J4Q44_G00241070 [Coregonus suidteri]|uniref:Uncharacterized protein n=1 Tax=Coregonus suidteri TaxID=861788 RepID=A0AAN8L562_9TELE
MTWCTRMVQSGNFSMATNVMQTLAQAIDIQFSQILTAGAVRDEGIVETMQTCWKENQYLLCPPTAGVRHEEIRLMDVQ